MAIDVIKGKYPHIGWVDLEGDGVLTEIAIMSNTAQGLSYIVLNHLDAIDKTRLIRIISNRNSHMYELWDLMSNLTLGNGANALEFFHQYVKTLTPSGQIIKPQIGRVAAPVTRRIAPRNEPVVEQAAPVRRGRGRPPKQK
jgi:hypothetical protein